MSRSDVVVKNILSILEARNESAFQAALNAGLSRTAIDDIIKGRSQSPRVDTLEKIATYFDLSVLSLLEERDDDALRQAIMDIVQKLKVEDQLKYLQIARVMATPHPEDHFAVNFAKNEEDLDAEVPNSRQLQM